MVGGGPFFDKEVVEEEEGLEEGEGEGECEEEGTAICEGF